MFAFQDSNVTSYFVVAGSGTTSATSGGYNVSKRDLPGAVASDLTNNDPLLDPAGLADNGGETDTIALLCALLILLQDDRWVRLVGHWLVFGF